METQVLHKCVTDYGKASSWGVRGTAFPPGSLGLHSARIRQVFLRIICFFFFFFICKATALVLQNYDIICKQTKMKCKFQTNSFKYENVLNEAMYPRVWLSLRPHPAESNTEDPRPSSRSVVGSAEGACWEPGLRGLWSALGYSSPGDPITSKLLQLPFWDPSAPFQVQGNINKTCLSMVETPVFLLTNWAWFIYLEAFHCM